MGTKTVQVPSACSSVMKAERRVSLSNIWTRATEENGDFFFPKNWYTVSLISEYPGTFRNTFDSRTEYSHLPSLIRTRTPTEKQTTMSKATARMSATTPWRGDFCITMVLRGLIASCTSPNTQVKVKKDIASGRITRSPPTTVLLTNSFYWLISFPSFRYFQANIHFYADAYFYRVIIIN